MNHRARAVFLFAVVTVVWLAGAPLALAQQALRADDEDRKDQVFEAIMDSVRTDFPDVSGFARIILPSPRWGPLTRFLYVRVEANGLKPNSTDPTIHLHRTRVDTRTGEEFLGCFANAPVEVNLKPLIADANGRAISVTRVVLNDDGTVNTDATRVNNTRGQPVVRATLTRWYVQYHIPPGEPNAGAPLACGEITLAGFDRGAAFK